MANRDWIKAGADGLTFGERLDDLMNSRGISQSQLADGIGVDQSAISEYINGKKGGTESRAPGCSVIIAMARYLAVSTDYLLGLTDIKTPSMDTQAIVDQTGLSESNVQILQYYANKEFFSQMYNDGIESMHNSDVATNYAFMLGTLNVPAPHIPSDIDDVIDGWQASGFIHQKGYVQLTGEEAFHYYCTRIAEEFKNALIEKYLATAKWKEK